MSNPVKQEYPRTAIGGSLRRTARFVLLSTLLFGCALFRDPAPGPIALPIPETPDAIRSEIEAERLRLLDLMNADLPDDDARAAHRKVVVAIAARLSQLEEALAATGDASPEEESR